MAVDWIISVPVSAFTTTSNSSTKVFRQIHPQQLSIASIKETPDAAPNAIATYSAFHFVLVVLRTHRLPRLEIFPISRYPIGHVSFAPT